MAAPVIPVPKFRVSAPSSTTNTDLGPLQDLPGTWVGNGFVLIARPDHQNNKPFFLEVNASREELTFASIGAPIINRGSAQNDIAFLGVHYLQRVSDAVSNSELHLETGMWLNVPATTAPEAPASITRLATIPHGDALLAQGNSVTVPAGPTIDPVSSTPITTATGKPVTNTTYLAPYTTTPLPPGIPAGAIANPNVVLTEAIARQKIAQTVALTISTNTKVGTSTGGIENIPFVVTNANATRMDAIFWIETVEHEDGRRFLQLQYTQTIMLNFLGIDWPHITVATLVKH